MRRKSGPSIGMPVEEVEAVLRHVERIAKGTALGLGRGLRQRRGLEQVAPTHADLTAHPLG
jgi:hypothetical protein